MSPASQLVAWYRVHRRPMPWRLKPTPYACYLSEIMLQQTTYEQALPYYTRFLKRFSTIASLARAKEADVLKAWEGLGYYARARNLLKAAKMIKDWPTSAAEWRQLPGIGPYTAAALASVLNGERVCVVDGNVARVFSRYWHLKDDFKAQKPREKLAARLVDFMGARLRPGDFNQAMMELGALVCTPTAPNCAVCPLKATCAARKADDAADYPKNAKRAVLPTRHKNLAVIRDKRGRVLMVRNDEGGLLRGLWDLPTIVQPLTSNLQPVTTYSQAFSHFKLIAKVYHLCSTSHRQPPTSSLAPSARFVDPRKVPLTTAARRILAL